MPSNRSILPAILLAAGLASAAKDFTCSGVRANAADIAACADELTAQGSQVHHLSFGDQIEVCRHGEGRIVLLGVRNQHVLNSVTSVEIAVEVGKIMDACTQSDPSYGKIVGGEKEVESNENVIVHANSI